MLDTAHLHNDDLLYVVRRPGLLVRSLLSVLVVTPILAVLFVKAFDLRQSVEVVLVALAISPVPPLLPQRSRSQRPAFVRAGADTLLGLAFMADPAGG